MLFWLTPPGENVASQHWSLPWSCNRKTEPSGNVGIGRLAPLAFNVMAAEPSAPDFRSSLRTPSGVSSASTYLSPLEVGRQQALPPHAPAAGAMMRATSDGVSVLSS